MATTPFTSPAAFEIPLQATPQSLTLTLNGITYQVVVKWNWKAQAWELDLLTESGDPFLMGIPLVTGSDLLEQFAYLGIGGKLVVQTDFDPDAVPTFVNLGTTGHLYFITE